MRSASLKSCANRVLIIGLMVILVLIVSAPGTLANSERIGNTKLFYTLDSYAGTLEIRGSSETFNAYYFSGRSDIKTVILNCDIDVLPKYAFAGCANLESIVFGSECELREIEDCAFKRCTKLKTFVVPSSVNSINDRAFAECRSLSSIAIDSLNTPFLGYKVFEGVREDFCVIYDGDVDNLTDEWKAYRIAKEHEHEYDFVACIRATIDKDGVMQDMCNICGNVRGNAIIPKIESVECKQGDVVYSGTAVNPDFEIYDRKGNLLEQNTDYIVLRETSNVNAGTAVYRIVMVKKYSGTFIKHFKILAADINTLEWNLEKIEYTYSGNANNPAVIAPAGLTADDYSVAYSNNTSAGTANVTITGKGNCAGTVVLDFKIKPAEITNHVISLSKTNFVYSGSVQKPTVSVSGGVTNSNYKVYYGNESSKIVGDYEVTVKGVNNFTGSKTLTYRIAPKGTSISKLKAGSKAFTATWAKNATQTSGYQLQYSTSSTFASGNKSKLVTATSTVSTKISSLTAKKKYYVRIRTYKLIGTTKYYSSWSATKSVTTLS